MFKHLLILWLVTGMMAGCLKQEDLTADGPKTRVTLINAALDSEPVTMLIDDVAINETPVSFGEHSGNSENAYLLVRPGMRNTAFQSIGGEPYGNKFFHWQPEAYYTLVQYDTARNGIAPWLIIRDQAETNDSLAKARFINAVAGDEALGLRLIRSTDTIAVSVGDNYVGETGAFNPVFSTQFKPGIWQMELINETADSLLESKEITFTEKTLYSLVAIGEKGGTGIKHPTVLVVTQVK